MSSSSRKRKHLRSRQYHDGETTRAGAPHTPEELQSPQRSFALYIQAHEADILRDPLALKAAQSLEVIDHWNLQPQSTSGRGTLGSALVRWNGPPRAEATSEVPKRHHVGHDAEPGGYWLGDEEDDFLRIGSGNKYAEGSGSYAFVSTSDNTSVEEEMWVDRYDVRLLLEVLPAPQEASPSSPAQLDHPSSPGGWSDLASDSEEAFFLSPHEIEDMRREKRRRKMDEFREERLRARLAEDEDDAAKDGSDIWGGSDEEPDDTQKELMRRTATHLLGSPNPAQLEMRILANHGGDKRFAFLRGRWTRYWKLTQAKIRIEMKMKNHKQESETDEAPKTATGLGGLTAYGDSDTDDSDSQQGEDEHAKEQDRMLLPHDNEQEATMTAAHDANAEIDQSPAAKVSALQEARRIRARIWAENRRAAKGTS